MATTAGYSGTPLPRKLGIRPDSRTLLVAEPATLDLGPLPPGAVVTRTAGGAPYDVILAFCPDQAALRRRVTPLARRLTPAGALWICWPKKASGVPTDLSDSVVRETGLVAGLVDVKVAAIDKTWSGLKFVYRLADRPRPPAPR
ncbi:MAG: DUF3052 family protein [Actinobacteria bacterium]|nr:DUF3052 family protein [Actinomycetota bacterium]MBI3686616.1 DUF3052 family protein [Actinomycetota bacterium]